MNEFTTDTLKEDFVALFLKYRLSHTLSKLLLKSTRPICKLSHRIASLQTTFLLQSPEASFHPGLTWVNLTISRELTQGGYTRIYFYLRFLEFPPAGFTTLFVLATVFS
jgi:hypothetical protein